MPNIPLALSVCEKMEIFDRKQQKIVFMMTNRYSQNKIIKIVNQAKCYGWWKKNGLAAFLKAVKEVNQEERENPGV